MNTLNNDKELLIEHAMQAWRSKRCIGTIFIPNVISPINMLVAALNKLFPENNSQKTVVIIVDNFIQRTELISYLSDYSDRFKGFIEGGGIKVFTSNFTTNHNNVSFISIWFIPKKYDKQTLDYITTSTFHLTLLDHTMFSQDEYNELYKKEPLINAFSQNDIDKVRYSTPVEESIIAVPIPKDSDTYKTLQKYDEYIKTSISIFGDLSNMDRCRIGDVTNNISSIDVAYSIATENGWSSNLDMTIEYNVQLDALYNPINLQERAKQTYSILRERLKLLTDYNPKIEKIWEIIKENKDKKVLIINKRGEFANEITEYINKIAQYNLCGNYHDKIEPIEAIDCNGNQVYYKSGNKKGQKKYLGAQAQKTLNVHLFNSGVLNILSTSASPDKDLQIDVDIVIITSPLCNTIEEYFYRLDKITFTQPLKLYTIFVPNSSEQKNIDSKQSTKYHKIVNNYKKSYVVENYSDFVIVD